MEHETLLGQLDQDLITAIKEKNALKTNVIRLLKSAIHNQQIAQGGELNDDQILQVLKSQVKSREEAIEQYEKGGSKEKAEDEKKELELIKTYMPEMTSVEQIEETVKKKIEQLNAKGKEDFGKVMGAIMAELGPRANGKIASQIVSKYLNT